MRPNPDERYQTAAEMLDAIKNLRRTDPRARRHRRRVALTAAVVSLLKSAGVSANRISFAGAGSDKDASKGPEANRVAVCIVK